VERFEPQPDQPLSVGRFFEAVNDWLDDDAIVISDIGDVVFGATELVRPRPDSFIAQGYYMSIGYSLPAALGAAYAQPDRRPVVFIGDGALQMTVQAIGTLIRYGKAPVVIVLNNDGYVIERMIHDGPYNELQMWRYSNLPDVFAAEGAGGIGCVARTEGQLCDALKTAADNGDRLVVIEAQVPRTDCTEVLARVGRSIRELSKQQ
jgi:indolepyruvate decarboxylase